MGNSPFRCCYSQWASDGADAKIQFSYTCSPSSHRWMEVSLEIPDQLKKAVLHRDLDCCRFCGFRAKKYQRVLARGNRKFDLENMRTSCPFCAQVVTVEKVIQMRSGTLIDAPDITQADLNALATVIYVARISSGESAEKARELLQMILDLQVMENEPGGGQGSTLLLNRLVGAETANEIGIAEERLRKFRLFALDRRVIEESDIQFNQFPQILAFWRSKDNGPFGKTLPTSWDPDFFDILINEGIRSPVRWRF